MKYAILQTGGKQYKVTEGSVIEVERLDVQDGANYIFDKVLMVADDGAFTLGQPLLDTVSIRATVVEQKRGKKIRVAKFKAKARHRRVMGHRQELTKLQIDSIVEASKPKRATAASAQTTTEAEVPVAEKKTATKKTASNA